MSSHPTASERKIRKGTRSCWECKRRKIRCIFASAQDDTCISCRRRRVSCVSQALPEDLSPAVVGSRHLGQRLSRVEDLVRGLLADRVAPQTPTSSIDVITPALSEEPVHPSREWPDDDKTALEHLRAALPSAEDVSVLLRESVRVARYTDLVNTQPHSQLTRQALAELRPLAPLAETGKHPVLLARRMLVFAIALQRPSGETFPGLQEPPSALMHRLVAAARTWVAANEAMHDTLDGLVCIVLEAVFEINAGHLRRAWAIYRRAMTAAQLMGLHRTPMTASPARIDPGLAADPAFLWFRIVYMDRYLSLLLGLPPGSADRDDGTAFLLPSEPPLGQFERRLAGIAARILEHNEKSPASSTDAATASSLDAALLELANAMPSSFWRPANFHNLVPGSPDALLETVRLGAHVYYYALVIQDHLPHMMTAMLPTDEGRTDGAETETVKMACAHAGREILTRFLAHRLFIPTASCSRPVDFFTFLAAMTILLAHLDAHHHARHPAVSPWLSHQRLSDRALLDQVLERMDAMCRQDGGDAVAEHSARRIRQLLDIEADAARGSRYAISEADSDRGQDLHLRIPCLGTIQIARQDAAPVEQATLVDGLDGLDGLTDDWALQGVDAAFFDSLMRGTSCPYATPEEQ